MCLQPLNKLIRPVQIQRLNPRIYFMNGLTTTFPFQNRWSKEAEKGVCVTWFLGVGTSEMSGQLYEPVDLVGPKAGLDMKIHVLINAD